MFRLSYNLMNSVYTLLHMQYIKILMCRLGTCNRFGSEKCERKKASKQERKKTTGKKMKK